jgi:hypothetical protein
VRLPDGNGDLQPFLARDYQRESLQCTATRQVDRWGRGLGKSTCGEIKEIHTSLNKQRYPILIACPQKAQAEKWYQDIKDIFDNSPTLQGSIVQTKQAPYYLFRLANKSTISIFTTGSESGKHGSSLRGQSPHRTRIDEQDLMNDGDFKAIMPLIRRYPDSEFHGSSTPLGKRETFYNMCKKFPDYRELHFPISVHPDWSPEMEEACMREARTQITYIHEFLAEFGEQEGGVFKANFLDLSRLRYSYKDCTYDPKKVYFLGVDWNGQGTGTRFRVIEYDPATQIRRLVDHAAVNISAIASMDKLRQLNKKWHCERVYIDKGYGHVQDEIIRRHALHSSDPDERRLSELVAVDFGAILRTNRLVPKRGNTKYLQDKELERPTKPFLVEGMMMAVESGLFEYSDDDDLIDEQLRAYRVKTYTKHGWANTYVSSVGDHDLDALMLAMLGAELMFGVTSAKERTSIAQIRYAPGFGEGKPAFEPGPSPSEAWLPPTAPQTAREVAQTKGNVPSRIAAQNMVPQPRVLTRDMHGLPQSYLTNRPVPTGTKAGVSNAGVSNSGVSNAGARNAPVPSRTNRLGSRSTRDRSGRGLYTR